MPFELTLADGAGHTFFEQTQFQRLLGNDLLQRPRLATKIRHLAARGRTGRVARQPRRLPASRNSFDQL